MIIYIFLAILSTVQASTGLDVVGYWSKIGECGSRVIDFNINGTMTHYEYSSGGYVSQGSVEWWISDGLIFTGQKSIDLVVMGIKVDTLNSLLFTGTMVFADESKVPFVWEKCIIK
jgi:hypothetical protein